MDEERLEDAFASVIGHGVKLSIALYHYASPLGSAGEDMKDVGAEITLFCAIMRQVRSTFDTPKSFRISITALHDIQDVLARGKTIFERIGTLLDSLQRQDERLMDIYTRVNETFRKSKVLMWKESLRSCTAMVQVMLTTMAFAERIASAGASTWPTEDEQLRDLMQSLLLAQQSTNTRLERLEDQTLLEEMQQADSSAVPSPNTLREDRHLRPAHARNRSSRAIFDIATNDVADLLAEGSQRTSVLLNRKIYQQENFQESQRRTWTSLSDHHQSFTQSNDLLQTWTDQCDPSPPYMLSWHGEYAEDAYKLDALQESLRKNREQVHMATETSYSKAPSTINASMHQDPHVNASYHCQSGADSGKDTNQQENDMASTLNMKWAYNHGGNGAALPHGEILGTNFDTLREAQRIGPASIVPTPLNPQFKDSVHAKTAAGLFKTASEFRKALDVNESATESSTEREPNEEHARSKAGDEGQTPGLSGDEEEVATRNASLAVRYPPVPRSESSPVRTPPTNEHQISDPGIEIFKSFRVGIEDPCSKVIPVALRKYGIQGDWMNYALYIVYGDQERCVGLQEYPLALFKDLDKEGKKPMFMLRKLATHTKTETDTKPPCSPNSVPSASNAAAGVPVLASGTDAKGIDNMELPSLTLDPGPEAENQAKRTSVEIFKTFRVSVDDPCWEVLPVALRKYNIQADWRQYSLWIVYGDQERCIGLEEKPLTIFKDLSREGKKPMFMLRKRAYGDSEIFPFNGGVKALGSGALTSSAASARTMQSDGTKLNAEKAVEADHVSPLMGQDLGSDHIHQPDSDSGPINILPSRKRRSDSPRPASPVPMKEHQWL